MSVKIAEKYQVDYDLETAALAAYEEAWESGDDDVATKKAAWQAAVKKTTATWKKLQASEAKLLEKLQA